MIRFFRSFLRNTQGIALMEFAMLVPVLLLMVYGTVEVSRYVQFRQKVIGTANQMGNLVNQNLNISLGSLNTIMNSTQEMMEPFPASNASVIITAIQQNSSSGAADVMWQTRRGGKSSLIAPGGKGSKVTLDNYVLIERDQVIAVEVFVSHQPIIWPEFFANNGLLNAYEYSLYRPRYGAFQFEPR